MQRHRVLAQEGHRIKACRQSTSLPVTSNGHDNAVGSLQRGTPELNHLWATLQVMPLHSGDLRSLWGVFRQTPNHLCSTHAVRLHSCLCTQQYNQIIAISHMALKLQRQSDSASPGITVSNLIQVMQLLESLLEPPQEEYAAVV